MIFDLDASSFALGERRVSVAEICEGSGRDYSRTLERTGFESIYRTEKAESAFFTDFLSGNLVTNPGDTVIFVNQSNGLTVPGIAPQVMSSLTGSDRVNVVEISDGCSGFVRALILAEALLQNRTCSGVSIICGEIYSKFIRGDSPSSPIFSDAVSHFRVVAGTGFKVRASSILNAFSDFKMISVNSSSDFLMEGPQVLSWAVRSAKTWSLDITAKHGAPKLDSIESWFFHQGSRVVVESIASAIGAKGSRPFTAGSYGNTSSSSIPIALRLAANEVRESSSIGLLGFGVGLSMVGVLLEAER